MKYWACLLLSTLAVGHLYETTEMRVYDTRSNTYINTTLKELHQSIENIHYNPFQIVTCSIKHDHRDTVYIKSPFDLVPCDAYNQEILVLHLSNGQYIQVTPEHPVWVAKSNHLIQGLTEGPLQAQELQVGDQLLSRFLEHITIMNIEREILTNQMLFKIQSNAQELRYMLAHDVWIGVNAP